MRILQLICTLAFASWARADSVTFDGFLGEVRETVKLYHSIGNGDKWSLRGTFVLTSHSEIASKEENPLSEQELVALEKASRTNGLYHLRAVSSKDERSASTFLKACSLVTSSLSDIIEISLDLNSNLLGVGITTTNPHCLPVDGDDGVVSAGTGRTFNTTVSVVVSTLAPGPDTQTYIQRLEMEKADKLRGDKGDNRSFFTKYWMYIVPVVIFLMVSSAASPEGQGR